MDATPWGLWMMRWKLPTSASAGMDATPAGSATMYVAVASGEGTQLSLKPRTRSAVLTERLSAAV